jgi:hypothetical protein
MARSLPSLRWNSRNNKKKPGVMPGKSHQLRLCHCQLLNFFLAADFAFFHHRHYRHQADTTNRGDIQRGVMFLLVMFFSPLVAMVPPYATAGALIFVGVLMTSSLARVNWDDFTESVPAFITTVMMPFTFSITEGIALGFMSYCIMKVCTGHENDVMTTRL